MKRFSINIVWAQSTLKQYGYQVFNDHKMVRSMPWSTVISFPTSAGFVYLKCTAKEFSREAALLKFLNHQEFPDLPTVIAINKTDNSFLMKEAGQPLRLTLTESYDTPIVCTALKAYAKLQISCIPHTNSLIKLGASDWRLGKLPQLYRKFLLQKRLLVTDGLSLKEIEDLQNLSEAFEALCQRLTSFELPETLEHGDFHDSNILLNKGQITINDFGDSTVSHPFFSIASFLSSTRRHYNFRDGDEPYVTLRDCYLQEWEIYKDKKSLLQAFDIASLLQPFIAGFNLARIDSCTGPEGFGEFHGHMAGQLRTLISNLSKYPSN